MKTGITKTFFLTYVLLLLIVFSPAALSFSLAPGNLGPHGRPISSVLNADGSIKRGVSGNFDPKGFRMVAGADGKPRFLRDTSAGTSQLAEPSQASQLVADCVDGWDDRFGVGGNGLNGFVFAIAVSGTNVYVGGSFTLAGGVSANRIARWDGSSWSPLGSGMNATVRALAVSGTDVYAAGDFTIAGGGSANRIAKWNGASWSALGSGINGPVHALAVSGNGDVYAGGDFTTAGGFSRNRIAKWNGSSWSALGSGISGTANGTAPRIFGIAVSGNGEVYAGGYFTTAGGIPANSIAKWNGSSWSSLSSGLFGAVHDISLSATGDVYIGGDFDAGGAHDLAKWNGSGWSALGSGVGGSSMWVFAVVVSGSDVYAGGHFTNAGGRPANNIAVWNGSGWSEFAAGTGVGSNAVYAAAVSGSDLYIGGSFSTAGCHEASYFSRYDLTVPPGPAPTPTPMTIAVTNSNDSGAGSLRQAIADATPGSTINFDPGVFATPLTITLTSGELVIDKDLTIQGPGQSHLSISGNGASRVFYIDWDITAALDGMTIRDGHADDGAGITNGGALTVSNSIISGNSAAYYAGGIRNLNTLTIINSTISGNTAVYADGGVGNNSAMTVTNSIISGNTAGGGGAIWNGGWLTVTNSTISGNTAGGGGDTFYDFAGGAIYNEVGMVTINNSTISGNTAIFGGGIFNTYYDEGYSGTVYVTNSTMSGNDGGAIFSNSSNEALRNTIVAGNTGGDISGTIETASHNLIGDAASSGGIASGVNGNIVGVNSLLGPLANNGGPTFTHALLVGSPAINAGNNCVLTQDECGDGNPALPTDQRGFPRVGTVDIGAFERQASDPTPDPTPTERTNFALASNGGVASASSEYNSGYPAVGTNNGDRKGLNWANGGGWNDATAGVYPDVVEIAFNGAKTIDEIDVFTVQDNYISPVEPDETDVFTAYGMTSFDVQYWNGSNWLTVPNGSITNNNKVWTKLTFSPVAASKIRVVVNASLLSYSRIVELEAWSGGSSPTPTPDPTPDPTPTATPTPDPTPEVRTNYALDSNDGVASASSEIPGSYPASGTNNGDRKGLNWASGGGWNDSTAGGYPDWLQIDFNGTKTIDEIDVFTVQDNFASPSEPALEDTFTQYGITHFDIQYWNGSAWVVVPGGSITSNNKVWTQVTFSPIATDKIRVQVNNSLASYSRIVEVEAWGGGSEPPPPPRTNFALASNGGAASASSEYNSGYPATGTNNGDRKGENWASGGGWNDATAGVYPDVLEIAFDGSKTIDEINVFTVQDSYWSPSEPTLEDTFTQYGITQFDIQYWNGSAWITVPGGSITGNNKVWTQLTFPAVTTNKIRVQVNNSLTAFSRIVEVEAWGGGG